MDEWIQMNFIFKIADNQNIAICLLLAAGAAIQWSEPIDLLNG